MSVLRVGLLGLDRIGAAYRHALERDDGVELVALADSNPQRTRERVGPCDAAVFEDCRSLIVAQTRDPIDALFVALPPSQWLDLAPLAAERGIPAFCHAPIGRTAGEASTVMAAFERTGVPIVVSRRWSAGLDADALADLRHCSGRMFHAHAVVRGTSDGSDWRGDVQRAGGGALLFDGYEAVDAFVHLIDVPQVVTVECGRALPPGGPKKYDTEDAAAVTLRFGRDQVGSISVCRGAAAPSWSMTIIGASGSLTFDDTGLIRCAGNAPESDHTLRPPSDLLAEDIAAFTAALRIGASSQSLHETTRQHVRTLATIEAAYLSSRTGSPETPAQFLGELA